MAYDGNTIRVKCYNNVFYEYESASTIKPGYICKLNSSLKLTLHGSEPGIIMVAVEDSLQGKTINDDYASGDVVKVVVPSPGDIIAMRCSSAVAAGDPVVPDGSAVVKKFYAVATTSTDYETSGSQTSAKTATAVNGAANYAAKGIVGIALDTLTGSPSNALIRVLVSLR